MCSYHYLDIVVSSNTHDHSCECSLTWFLSTYWHVVRCDLLSLVWSCDICWLYVVYKLLFRRWLVLSAVIFLIVAGIWDLISLFTYWHCRWSCDTFKFVYVLYKLFLIVFPLYILTLWVIHWNLKKHILIGYDASFSWCASVLLVLVGGIWDFIPLIDIVNCYN